VDVHCEHSGSKPCQLLLSSLREDTLYSALYGTYTVTLNELKGVLKASLFEENETAGSAHQEEGFQEVRPSPND
jgi:hypothetical protein